MVALLVAAMRGEMTGRAARAGAKGGVKGRATTKVRVIAAKHMQPALKCCQGSEKYPTWRQCMGK